MRMPLALPQGNLDTHMLNCELEKPTHTQLMTIDNSSTACDAYY